MDSETARTQELWPVIVKQINTARMATILGAANRVYRAPPNDFSTPEAAEGTAWGRVVVLPTTTLWTVEGSPDLPRVVAFNVRVEAAALQREDFDPTVLLEAAQVEVLKQLHGFSTELCADGEPFRYMVMAEPIYRHTNPTDPMMDDERGVWMSAAQYRTRISSKPE